MLNKRESTPMVLREEGPTRLDISVEGPEIDNRQDSQDIDFSVTKLDGKAYDKNETIAKCVNAALKSLAQS